MYKLAIILLSLMLTVAPVSGQAIPPTPTPLPAGSTEALLQRLAATLEQMSANDTQTINASVLLLGVFNLLFFAGGLVFVYRGGLKPLYNTMDSDRKRADKAESDADSTRLQIAQTLERAANTLANMSTKQDDETRTNAAAAKIVKDVGGRIDEAVKPIDGGLKKVAETLEELKKDVVTKQTLTDTIDPLVKKIDAALQVIHDLQQPQPSPAPTPPAEGDTLSPETKAGES